MNEKDLLDKLKQNLDPGEVPPSLQPDAIEQMLKETQRKSAPEKSAKRMRFITRMGGLAAACALVIGSAWQTNRVLEKAKDKAEAVVASSTETESDELFAATAADLLLTAETNAEKTDAEACEEAIAEDAVAENAATEETFAEENAAEDADLTDTFTYADSYESIYELLKEQFVYEYDMITYSYEESAVDTADGGVMRSGSTSKSGTGMLGSSLSLDASNGTVDTVEDMAAATVEDAAEIGIDSTSADSAASGDDFSDTNIQEKGVDEADIVKTDGNYIYILRSDGSFAIVQADSADSTLVSITDLSIQNDFRIQELYLDGDTLNVITVETVTNLVNDGELYYTSTTRQTVLYTYDVTDRSAPVLTGTVSQEGNYSDSRKVGSHIYLFTTYYPELASTYEESNFIPLINGVQAKASDFYLPEHLQDRTYLVISSVDTRQPDQIADSKILVSGASCFYVSTENIYIANTIWTSDSERTEITKFHYEDGVISGVAAASVKGYLNDSFSLNEYNGYLRVVSTYYGTASTELRNTVGNLVGVDLSVSSDWEEHNGLFVFDSSLKQTGQILDLAAGETIRSARFFGDTGYFVTFRQTDPLFSVDLSDPTTPQILGELKISGFSSYLHFYGENLLLGLGYEADEDTGITTGLKLSMFDISDPSNVTEQNRFTISGITWCPAIEDYKALLVNSSKNLIGFYCDNRYLLYSYDEASGFTQELVYDFYADQLTGAADYDNMRGLFIGDTLYLAGESFVISFDMENGFEKTGVLRIE